MCGGECIRQERDGTRPGFRMHAYDEGSGCKCGYVRGRIFPLWQGLHGKEFDPKAEGGDMKWVGGYQLSVASFGGPYRLKIKAFFVPRAVSAFGTDRSKMDARRKPSGNGLSLPFLFNSLLFEFRLGFVRVRLLALGFFNLKSTRRIWNEAPSSVNAQR